jgi:hypothetical protein
VDLWGAVQMMTVSFSREKSGLEMAITKKKKHSKNDRGKINDALENQCRRVCYNSHIII